MPEDPVPRGHHAASLWLSAANSESGTSMPRSWQALKIRKWRRGGKHPFPFQLETAGAVTPNIAATSLLPPNSLITSATVMSHLYSRSLNLVKRLEREQTPRALNGNIRVMRLLDQIRPRSNDAIAERLELTRQAMGMTQRAFAMDAGLTPPAYNNWKQGLSRPDLDGAFMLCDAYGLTIEWVYEGDASRLPAQLVEKLRALIAKRREETAA